MNSSRAKSPCSGKGFWRKGAFQVKRRYDCRTSDFCAKEIDERAGEASKGTAKTKLEKI